MQYRKMRTSQKNTNELENLIINNNEIITKQKMLQKVQQSKQKVMLKITESKAKELRNVNKRNLCHKDEKEQK